MKNLAIFAISIALCGCVGTQSKNEIFVGPPVAKTVAVDGGGQMVVADVDAMNQQPIAVPLSALTEGVEIVRLESRAEALVNTGQVVVSDSFIGFFTLEPPFVFKLFDRSGRYLRDIGRQGRGPGEYSIINAAAIDEAAQKIYILSIMASELLVFGIDGTVQEPIKLAHNAPMGVFEVNADGTFSFAAVSMDEAPVWAWTQDAAGMIVNQIMAPTDRPIDFNCNMTAAHNVGRFDPFAATYQYTPGAPLSYYDVATGRSVPVFDVANLAARKPLFVTLNELPHHFMGSYSTEMGATELLPNGGGVSEALPPVHFLVEKASLRGGFCTFAIDELGGLKASDFFAFQRGYFVDNRSAITLKADLKKLIDGGSVKDSAALKRLNELNDSLTEEDNNVIFLAKLKQ